MPSLDRPAGLGELIAARLLEHAVERDPQRDVGELEGDQRFLGDADVLEVVPLDIDVDLRDGREEREHVAQRVVAEIDRDLLGVERGEDAAIFRAFRVRGEFAALERARRPVFRILDQVLRRDHLLEAGELAGADAAGGLATDVPVLAVDDDVRQRIAQQQAARVVGIEEQHLVDDLERFLVLLLLLQGADAVDRLRDLFSLLARLVAAASSCCFFERRLVGVGFLEADLLRLGLDLLAQLVHLQGERLVLGFAEDLGVGAGGESGPGGEFTCLRGVAGAQGLASLVHLVVERRLRAPRGAP